MAQFDLITNLHCLSKGLPHFQSFLYAQMIRLKQFYVNGNVNRMIVGTVYCSSLHSFIAMRFCFSAGLSFTEAERRLKENGPNVPVDFSFPSWWNFLWHAFFHPFNIILIVLSVISYITSDSPNGCIMLVLVLISVCLRFYQVFLAYNF